MSDEIINALNQVLYYMDEYKKGNPEVDDAIMKEIAKITKSQLKGNKIHYIFYKLFMSYIKIRIALVSYETIQDERFVDLSNQFLIDIYIYKEYTDFLKKYLSECIKNNTYENLDNAYLLSIKLEEMMQALNVYIDDIYKILKEDTSNYIVCYPKNDYSEIKDRKDEINKLMLKLKKDPE